MAKTLGEIPGDAMRALRSTAQDIALDLWDRYGPARQVMAPRRKREYLGAAKGRRTTGWLTQPTSANTENARAIPNLRDRSRDLVRNNPHAASFIEHMVSNAIGTGAKPKADPRARELWDSWAPYACNGSPIGAYALQALLFRSFLESGEVLMRERPRRTADGLPVPMQFQPLESDLLDSTKDGMLQNGGRIVQGVEFGPFGEIAAYWMFKEHPGDSGAYQTSYDSVRVSADQVSHIFRPTRPGQVRGVPWMAPVIRAMWDLEGADDAERVRRKLESCAMAIVTGGDPDEAYDENDGVGDAEDPDNGGTLTDGYGNVMEGFEPGMIARVPPGKSIEFFQPHSNPNFETYYREELHHIAAGLGVPYEVLSGDLSQVNYSSIRMGALEFRRLIRALREFVVVPMILVPMWKAFINMAIAAGKLPPGTYPAKWAFDRFEEVDRLKEAKADLQDMLNGTSSRSEIIADKGKDPVKVLAEIASDNDAADAVGCVFASDGRYDFGVVPTRDTEPES